MYEKLHKPLYGPNDEKGLSLYKIRRHLEDSLRRLQTDHVELYQMHHIDRRTTWDEIWGAFEGLVNQGKIDYIGSSNFAGCTAQDMGLGIKLFQVYAPIWARNLRM
ncbi:aldo/keto reductase [Paenibacillus curdlanolyticus YK9]|uniref:Aldo/keto reductase n=1 Tax=Paenibacillus curdlanolyticus YK9 TaxID=717606 RepID=E0IGM8_9BACL|nr:aldo/keto reductase [Paenibacillus curdlanolyticus YK9]